MLEAGSARPIVAHPDELLTEAVARMARHDVGRLPVVDRDDPRRLEGYLGRTGVIAAWTKGLEEEIARERGWITSRVRRVVRRARVRRNRPGIPSGGAGACDAPSVSPGASFRSVAERAPAPPRGQQESAEQDSDPEPGGAVQHVRPEGTGRVDQETRQARQRIGAEAETQDPGIRFRSFETHHELPSRVGDAVISGWRGTRT
ncbi:MAG TPA: CBS domain-containing protein [Verrucomicrobiae bacterium]|nr:CBS domain-containing protein [Verrucomicrobiae bacterium]